MSGGREIVSDTGPLITLEKLIDGFRFIRLLYDKVVIPRQCARRLGIQISGIAGQVVKALRSGLISNQEAQDKLRELFEAGRISRKIHAALTETVRQEG